MIAFFALAGCGGGGSATGGSGGASASSSSGSDGGSGGGGGGASYPDPYTQVAFDKVRITSDSSQPNFQQANTEIDLHDGPFASVKLIVDLESTCFPFESWKENPPPQGHNWPANCDAFDRNFEFSLDDPMDPAKDPPGIELERAITPFGGPLHLEVDMTDVANGLPGKHRLKTIIPTYSDGAGQVSGSNGGWNVSARIEAVPGLAPRKVLAVVPLYYGSQTDMAGPGALSFNAPEGVTGSRIEYRVTGHGGGAVGSGCIGPAEEFCKRTHVIKVDGAEIASIMPWRNDCKKLCTLTHYGPASGGFDYCLENPCGNIQSVKASRANWCPGSETPPIAWEPEALKTAGPHSLEWGISTVEAGGQWRISATYFAFGD